MRYVIPIDLTKFPEGFHSEILAGPNTGIQSCYMICSRVQPGAKGPALHIHPADQFYYILTGTMNVQLGEDKFVVGPETLVRIPEGTPHCNWNTGSEDEVHLELIIPAPPREQILKPAEPRKIPNASELIVPLDRTGVDKFSAGFRAVWAWNRKAGSRNLGLHVDEVDPGSGGPSHHIHRFDQFYLVREGTMTVDVGVDSYQASGLSAVVLPAGVVHRNYNATSKVEKHITVLPDEPKKGEIFDYPVQITYKEIEHGADRN